MFKAIWRYITTIFRFGAGRVNKAREAWQTDPTVINETYNEIKASKIASIEEVRKALGMIIQLQAKSSNDLAQIHKEIDSLTKKKNGALALANARKDQLVQSGVSVEQLKEMLTKDSEYLKCRTAFQDFTSTLESKLQEVDRLNTSVNDLSKKLEEYKIRLQKMRSEMERIDEERASTIADIQFAKQRKEIADMEAGIAVNDNTSTMRAEIQSLRQQAIGTAKAAEIYAGTDAKEIAQEFEDYAESKAAADAFDSLILSEPDQPSVEHVALPEN